MVDNADDNQADYEPGPASNYDYAFGASADDNQADYAAGPEPETPAWGGPTPRQTQAAISSKAGSPGGGMGTGMDWASAYKSAAQANNPWNPERGGIRMGAGPTGGASGAAGSNAYGVVKTSKTILPKGQAWPTFQAPTWDEKAIRAKARKVTAPLIAEMGMKVQQVMSRYYENPNVRKMVLRDTLAGYGIGIGRAISQGESAARAEYGQEYGREWGEAMANYNMAKEKLLSQAEQVTTTSPVYSKKQYEDLVGTAKGNNTKKVQYTLSGRSYTTSV